ncbi:MAG TPA: hypothetical protein VKS78_01255 [Roseiarcus sp.]|nr:hypothetical protein [Roseiarcus sp.]
MALALALFHALDAKAADAGQTIGAGLKLCAEFSQAYAENPAATEAIYWPWAMGMMSGLNFASVANSTVFRDLTGDQDIYRRAIVSYCKAHPLTTYTGAVLDLYISFPLKKGASK